MAFLSFRSLVPAWSKRSREPRSFSKALESTIPPPMEIDSMEEEDDEYWEGGQTQFSCELSQFLISSLLNYAKFSHFLSFLSHSQPKWSLIHACEVAADEDGDVFDPERTLSVVDEGVGFEGLLSRGMLRDTRSQPATHRMSAANFSPSNNIIRLLSWPSFKGIACETPSQFVSFVSSARLGTQLSGQLVSQSGCCR